MMEMHNASTVSVIIPVWNARETLAETLRSVALQTEPPWEVILIDDGSTDESEEVARNAALPIRYYRQANSGPSLARNDGFQRSTGSLVAFLDADDLWPADTLRILTGCMNRRPDADIVHGRMRDLWPDFEGGGTVLGSARWALNIGSALFRRSVFDRTGGFNPLMRTGEDFEFWLRCREQGIERSMVEDVTLHYRRKLVDRIDGKRRHNSLLLRTLKQSIDRRTK